MPVESTGERVAPVEFILSVVDALVVAIAACIVVASTGMTLLVVVVFATAGIVVAAVFIAAVVTAGVKLNGADVVDIERVVLLASNFIAGAVLGLAVAD